MKLSASQKKQKNLNRQRRGQVGLKIIKNKMDLRHIIISALVALMAVVGGLIFFDRPEVQVIENKIGAAPGATFSSEYLEWGNDPQLVIPVKKSIPAGQTNATWRNTFPNEVYCSNATFSSGGTASTTYHFNLYATSTNGLAAAHNYTLLTDAIIGANARLIRNWQVATSTTATTTSTAKLESWENFVVVGSGNYLVGTIQNLPTGGGGAGCNGATCETATSTNRGVSPTWRAVCYR